jgi:hypothetical protein
VPHTPLTPGQIFDMWMVEAQAGLSGLKTKTFDPSVYANQRPRAIAHIQKILDGDPLLGIPPKPFESKDEKATKRVAKDLGKICRLLIAGKKVVPEDIFDRVRRLVSNSHTICKAATPIGGGGDWCGY